MGRAGGLDELLELPSVGVQLDDLIVIYRPRAERFGWNKPEHASGSCWHAAAEFTELARKHGVEAEWLDLHVRSHDDYATHWQDGDFQVHAVALIYLPTGSVTVDWTASQFGISEFPYLRPWSESSAEVYMRSTEPIDINGDELEMAWLDELSQ
jgi:hypothetical protein